MDHPAYVELLNEMEMHEFGLDGVKILPLISCLRLCLFNVSRATCIPEKIIEKEHH